MSTEYETTETLDVKGMNCPMPVVKSKQAVDALEPGDVLEVLATDPGSMSDVRGWSESVATVELLDQIEDEEDGDAVYRHFLRRVEA